MTSILEQLRLGHLSPNDRSFKRGSKYQKVAGHFCEAADTLLETLTPEQKILYEAFEKAQNALQELSLTDQFIYGFRTGLLIGLEASGVIDTFLVNGE